MTTARSFQRSSPHSSRSSPVLAMLAALAFALSLVLTSIVPAAAQDDEATAAASPTAEELEQLREQAIADEVDQLELELTQFNDSGVDGTATFYDLDGEETLVAIEIEGGGDAHPAYILEGTCGNTEPEPVERLTVVDDTGVSLTRIDRSLESLVGDTEYVVDLRLSPQDLGVLIACANIEGTPTPATPDAGTPEDETPVVEPTGAGGTGETPTATSTAAADTTTPTPDATTPTVTATTAAEATADTGDTGDQDGTGGPEAAPDTVASLPLGDYSGLGVTGTVSLLALDDDTTRIKITLTGDAVTGGHIAHLHPGTCANPQDEGTIYLQSVGADGISETTVGVALNDLLTGGWVINVHLSEDAWDTWLVCGELSAATDGMTGVLDVTPVVGGKGSRLGAGDTEPTPVAGGSGDGTSGVSGKGEPSQTSSLAQGVGVGSTLMWPDSPAQSVALALGSFALVLLATGLMLRQAQRTHRQPSRWQRLGL